MDSKLAVKTPHGGWRWVARRDSKLKMVVTSLCKEHALWPEDLKYFMDEFPEDHFKVTGALS